jgi:hypothetical protein
MWHAFSTDIAGAGFSTQCTAGVLKIGDECLYFSGFQEEVFFTL